MICIKWIFAKVDRFFYYAISCYDSRLYYNTLVSGPHILVMSYYKMAVFCDTRVFFIKYNKSRVDFDFKLNLSLDLTFKTITNRIYIIKCVFC